ncbi:TetR family transcriptional regulator [Brachybacterium ginsengisoli]|uniref:TetR family transcriptional regulator n=1 Tax=Brachybacterium ginsengisoli TaxID=1331682 RepID=A0A291GWH0_9MICO|nr:TetR/AcrR family transcriptional regulator [Brachybacterium ginsengisoli]ATG54492.1 TetR family transcriptional regulator [Brachybacterium ginsengisoli]
MSERTIGRELLEGEPGPARSPEAAPPEAATEPVPRGRREEILDGAADMFAEHGYHGSSLRDISQHIGISHSGMLHHFDSKDALLDGVIDRLEAHAQTGLERIPQLRSDRNALLLGLAEHWHPASLPIRLLATLDAESVSAYHHGRFRMARLRKVHEHVLEHCFTGFAEQGLLREGADPAFAGRSLLAVVLSLAVREKTVRPLQSEPHDDAPMKDIAMQVDGFFLEPRPAAGPARRSR